MASSPGSLENRIELLEEVYADLFHARKMEQAVAVVSSIFGLTQMLAAEQKRKSVRVRIAVVVDDKGRVGTSEVDALTDDETAIGFATLLVAGLPMAQAIVDVDIPMIQSVTGRLVEQS